MSHEITQRADGSFEFAFVGERAGIWHGLGQQMQADATEKEWVEASGMGYRVQRGIIRYATERGADADSMLASSLATYPDQHILFRSDTKAPLGVVSPKYKVVQPAEVFHFFRELIDGNGFALDTAGTLFGGRKYWALAKVDQAAIVSGVDAIEQYLLLVTSADGSSPTIGKFLATRVVCNNTMSIGLSEKSAQVKVTHKSAFNAEHMKAELGNARQGFAAYLGAARALARARITRQDAEQFVAKLLVETNSTTRDDVQESAGFKSILNLFKGSAMGGLLMTAEGTKWGLLNAITEHVDHASRAKSDSHRMNNSWFGKGDAFKTRAAEMLMAE
jgi:phage/plasmid-like protein (TIGR03299 family)